MGSPGGMIGHTSTGDIQWLGSGRELDRNFDGELLTLMDLILRNTKFIVVEQGCTRRSSPC